MGVLEDDVRIDQLRRLVATAGWRAVVVDTSGATLRVTFEAAKSSDAPGPAVGGGA
jgi:hypothetical protein